MHRQAPLLVLAIAAGALIGVLGEQLELTMPRGPMGLSGAPTVADPDAPQD